MDNQGSAMTARLARFVVDSRYEDLPADAVMASRRSLIDWLGVALGGSRSPLASPLMGLAREMGGRRESTVLGGRSKTSAFNAALVNGALSHVLDFDDHYQPGHLHPGATLFPSILAVAERGHLSGKALISAFALGFEVEARVADESGAELLARGWHPTACLGVLGSAAGVGKLLGLSAEQMANCLGIAFTRASGVVAAFGTMAKSLQVGQSVASGLLAAQLARRGCTGPKEVLLGEKGFFRVYLGMADPERVVDELGKGYRVVKNSFKPYPCCRATHAAVDAVLALGKKYGIRPDQVSEIVCQVWPIGIQVASNPEPRTELEGKFSIEYCVSVALADCHLGQEQFSDARLADPGVRELTRNVSLSPNAAFDDRHAIVTVRTRDGRQYEERTACVRGDSGNPLSWEDLEHKFRGLADGVVATGDVDRMVGLITELEKLEDISSLVGLCAT
ncbi:MAG: MmgE/PrpD family protein [Chloroflexota bacterium]